MELATEMEECKDLVLKHAMPSLSGYVMGREDKI
jgi:hypothetical protein